MILKTGFNRELDNWLIEWVVPGVFTMALLGAVAYLGYCTWQSHAGQPEGQASAANYAISAFAN